MAEATAHSVKLRADGTQVQEPALPDWAKGPAKKETKDTKDAKRHEAN